QSTDSPEFTIINLDGNSYMENMMGSGESGCFSFPADQAASQMDSLGTANFVGNISPESLVARGENVNGILTDHYTIKEAQLFGLGVEITSAKGDVWVTPDGKYTIKYIYEAEGKFAQMSTGATITGTFTMSFDLTDINKVAEVTVPQSCLDQQQQMADVPMMADAGQVSNLSGMITYITASEANVVKEFYMTQAAGWTVSDDSSMEGFVSFKITKGDKVYNVMVTANAGGGSMVILTLEQ
ncbi:MAG TPA: hypothetical protein VFF78_06330, partial [Anaerolineaceae bacterium]|nr:hypothetical protein [Anaerolineaceae bacterium]